MCCRVKQCSFRMISRFCPLTLGAAFREELSTSGAQSIQLGEPRLNVELCVEGFEDDFVAVAADADYFAGEAERLRETHLLTAPVHGDLGVVVGH